jgi:hypothetical protein
VAKRCPAEHITCWCKALCLTCLRMGWDVVIRRTTARGLRVVAAAAPSTAVGSSFVCSPPRPPLRARHSFVGCQPPVLPPPDPRLPPAA